VKNGLLSNHDRSLNSTGAVRCVVNVSSVRLACLERRRELRDRGAAGEHASKDARGGNVGEEHEGLGGSPPRE